MIRLVLMLGLIALCILWQPSEKTNAQFPTQNQKRTLPKLVPFKNVAESERLNAVLKEAIKKNDDTLRALLKDFKEPIVKYRYKTKVVMVHDTVFYAVPVEPQEYISDTVVVYCKPDTVYLPLPKKRSFLFRIF